MLGNRAFICYSRQNRGQPIADPMRSADLDIARGPGEARENDGGKYITEGLLRKKESALSAAAHPPKKKKLAQTLRNGAILLFGAFCATESAHGFRGATLSNRRKGKTCFPWRLCASTARIVTTCDLHLEYYCKFGNITVLLGLGFKNVHKSHVLAYRATEMDLNIVQSATDNISCILHKEYPFESLSVCLCYVMVGHAVLDISGAEKGH